VSGVRVLEIGGELFELVDASGRSISVSKDGSLMVKLFNYLIFKLFDKN
jgi:hypothetical protein